MLRKRVDPARARLRAEVDPLLWYHTIDLPHSVRTPGMFDTVAAAPKTVLPSDLTGKRCLDVATANGFWAFEMERRGAAEVVAVDLPTVDALDVPNLYVEHEPGVATPYGAFAVAHRALGSRVKHHAVSVYDLDREAIGGFDVIFVGSVLLHLRDPVGALMNLHTLSDGALILNESFDLPLTLLRRRTPSARLIGVGRSNWWVPNIAGLRQMLYAAGFEVTAAGRPYALRWGAGAFQRWREDVEGASPMGLARKAARAAVGIPHISISATRR